MSLFDGKLGQKTSEHKAFRNSSFTCPNPQPYLRHMNALPIYAAVFQERLAIRLAKLLMSYHNSSMLPGVLQSYSQPVDKNGMLVQRRFSRAHL
jgi:hypothetical protein